MEDEYGASEDALERVQSDSFANWLGINLIDLDTGYAKMELTLEEHHANFHGTPHGGVVYSLADSAFAAAGNTGGKTAVGLETNISYLTTVSLGTSIVARAERTHQTERTEEYQVEVKSADGEVIATFRGRTYKP